MGDGWDLDWPSIKFDAGYEAGETRMIAGGKAGGG